jgi:hypothetical protein
MIDDIDAKNFRVLSQAFAQGEHRYEAGGSQMRVCDWAAVREFFHSGRYG